MAEEHYVFSDKIGDHVRELAGFVINLETFLHWSGTNLGTFSSRIEKDLVRANLPRYNLQDFRQSDVKLGKDIGKHFNYISNDLDELMRQACPALEVITMDDTTWRRLEQWRSSRHYV